MKVRIVCYEGGQWILGKFARKLQENLLQMGVDCDIANVPSAEVDVNHHIIYINYLGKRNAPVETLMITHIDATLKLSRLIAQEDSYDVGICMSQQTMQQLIKGGVTESKVTYINPAHDNVIEPRKLVLGISSKTHNDGRKKEDTLVSICRQISNKDFAFKIMGSGWTGITNEMKSLGFDVEYIEEFDYDTYVKMMPRLDYYLYMSFDEGSMGFIDAVAAGVKTIVTPQGYHLDAPDAITYAVNNEHEIIKVLNSISSERNKYISAVKDWTWKNYTEQHVDLWSRLLDPSIIKTEIPAAKTSVKRSVKYLYLIYSFFYRTAKKLLKR